MRKISSLFLLLLFVLPSFAAGTVSVPGDVDHNGILNIYDVTNLIDFVLCSPISTTSEQSADIDEDGVVNVNDVVLLIDWVLHGDHGLYVDLGLPSGTLWATRNVGASRSEDVGDYFAWGETSSKYLYNWSTYKWCNGSSRKLTKYCVSSTYGIVDNKRTLDPEDDAAYVNWGPLWRMPSSEQQQELIYKCNWEWTTRNGIKGYLVKSKTNGNSMFIPITGHMEGTTLIYSYNYGGYWSRSLSHVSSEASVLDFNAGGANWASAYLRDYGYAVRAVRVSQN